MTEETSKDVVVSGTKVPKKYKWKGNKKQRLFIEYWISTTSETFGNVYRSGLKAGFSNTYSLNLTHLAPRWLSEQIEKLDLTNEHIVQGLQSIAIDPKEYNNSRSPADTRVKAFETLAKIKGMIDKQGGVSFNFVQPILGGESVNKPTKLTRKVVEADQTPDVDKLIPED